MALAVEITGNRTTGLGACLPTVRAATCGLVDAVRFPVSLAVITRS